MVEISIQIQHVTKKGGTSKASLCRIWWEARTSKSNISVNYLYSLLMMNKNMVFSPKNTTDAPKKTSVPISHNMSIDIHVPGVTHIQGTTWLVGDVTTSSVKTKAPQYHCVLLALGLSIWQLPTLSLVDAGGGYTDGDLVTFLGGYP